MLAGTAASMSDLMKGLNGAPFDGVGKESNTTKSQGGVKGGERSISGKGGGTKFWQQLDIRQFATTTKTPSVVKKSNDTEHQTLEDSLCDVKALPGLTEDKSGSRNVDEQKTATNHPNKEGEEEKCDLCMTTKRCMTHKCDLTELRVSEVGTSAIKEVL